MEKRLIVVLFLATMLLLAGGAIGNNVEKRSGESTQIIRISDDQWVEVKLKACEKPAKATSSYQPIVVITSPPDGAVVHERVVVVEGYAQASTPECKLTYWCWTWECATGSVTNCSYIAPPADYVEFRIVISGLWLGANVITVTFHDACGMIGSDQITIYYEDIYKPVVKITYPPDGSVFRDPLINVEGYADDDYGIGISEFSWYHAWEGGEEADAWSFETPVPFMTFSIPIMLREGWNLIEVRAWDLAGNEGFDSVEVYYVLPLTADADGPYLGGIGEEIQFYGNASGGAQPYSWHWDFGDGAGSDEQNPKHAYSKAGKYTATLTVTDSLGNVAKDTAEVTITANLTADAGGPYFGKVKEKIQFKGVAHGGTPPYSWHWDFGDGTSSDEQNPKHAYKRAGRYIAKLTVTDSEGKKATDTAEVTVYEELKADADGPYGARVGQTIFFHGSAKGGVPPYAWTWNFGDGAFSNLQNPAHAYSAPGAYMVTLTVTDSIGNVATDSTWAYVYEIDNVPPTVNITKPTDGLYINDEKIMPLRNKTVILGRITIKANASDNIGVARVDFYIDDKLVHMNYTKPYYWLWDEFAIGRHTIKVVAHDFEGNSAFDEQKVWIINLKLR